MPLPVLLIHRITDQCLVESVGSTKHLFLRPGTPKGAHAWVDTVGEIQGEGSRPATSSNVPSRYTVAARAFFRRPRKARPFS